MIPIASRPLTSPGSLPETRLRSRAHGGPFMTTMTDIAWHVVAVSSGALIAAVWVIRERAIHRRRRRRTHEEESRE